MTQIPAIDIDGAYVERLIMELGAIGAHSGTGVWRTVYSPEWVEANALVSRWFEDAGLTVRQDAVGNFWGRLEGTEGGKSIVSGSHIDTQRPGGRYDGALGVLAALVAIRALRERFGQPKRTLEAVSLCEEEGSRFPTANFWGSRVITGRIHPGDTETVKDFDGISIAEAMCAVGLDPQRIAEAKRDDIEAFVELHIEQGPVLESIDLPLGVVLGTFGVERHGIRFTGQSAHAGSTPMTQRRDAFGAAAKMGLEIREIAKRNGGVCTVGSVVTKPGIVTAVVGQCDITLDQRHLDAETLAKMLAEAKEASYRFAQEEKVSVEWSRLWQIEPLPFHPELIEMADAAVRETCGTVHRLPSGPLHDAAEVRRAGVPTVMLFVQSLRGLSHAKEEDTKEEHLELSVQALDRLASKTIDWLTP